MKKILHVHCQARFQGGIERILFDIARSLSPTMEQGLLFTDGGSDIRFLAPFAWHGMCLQEALASFKPDLAIIHKTDCDETIRHVIDGVPTIVFPHDHDLTCPRRHKYLPLSDKPCERAVGAGCIKNLCFIERSAPDNKLPVTLFAGIMRQRRLMSASRQAEHFLVASQAMQASLVKNGIDTGKIRVIAPIPAGLNDISHTPLRADIRAELLFVGQVIRGKGVDLMLRAAAQLTADFHLTIIGEGNHLAYCQQLAERLNLSHKVTFTGWVDHHLLDTYYQRCRCLVVPSRWPEPFGMVGVEAMARGRPVVAFDVGGISDWLTHNQTGLLACPGDTEDLARQLLIAISNEHHMALMAANAYRQATENFNHQQFIRQLTAFINEVIP
jgi:glycosyltransferase involved in cell wall biosynthesis